MVDLLTFDMIDLSNGESKSLLLHTTVLLAALAAQVHHRHLQLHHEQLDLTLLDKLRKGLQNTVLRELLSSKDDSLCGQVANSTVEYLESEEFFHQRVVFKERCLESVDHRVLVDKPALTRKVFVDNSKNSKDILLTSAVLEQLVVDPEDSQQEFTSEWEVEFWIFANQLCNQREHIQHTKLEMLVLRLILPK